MKFEANDLAKAIVNGNWQLIISFKENSWRVQVLNEKKCNHFLEQAMLSEASDVFQGTKALFYYFNGEFRNIGDGDLLVRVIQILHNSRRNYLELINLE